MVRIAISQAAFDAIVATMSLARWDMRTRPTNKVPG